MLKLTGKEMFTQQRLVGTSFSSTVLVSMVNMLNLARKKNVHSATACWNRFLKFLVNILKK